MWSAILVLVVIVICICLYNPIKDRVRCRYYLGKIPGPKKKFLIGNVLDILCEFEIVFQRFRAWTQEFGPIYNISTIGYSTVQICGAENFERIGLKHLVKSDIYFLFKYWLGEGLLTSKRNKWYTRRKILTPAFHFGILQDFVKVFNEESQNLVEVLKNMDGSCIDVIPIISQFTFKTITETAMGTKLNLQNDADKKFVTATCEIGRAIFYRVSRPWLYFTITYYYFSPMGFKEAKCLNTVHGFCDKIINKRRAALVNSENYNYSERKKQAMLDVLLKAQLEEGLIDQKGIQDEVNTFMFEGHDTTAMSICFTLMLLAKHKKIQDLLYQEMVEILETDTHPTINQLKDLQYMERCIKESLRLYPSVPSISRILDEDVMTIEGYLLPKMATCNIHLYDIHRNPKYWKDPDRFDPDRFLPENCINRHPFAYVPFSAGPRNCIGQKFAMLEQKAVLSGILRSFILEPIDKPETIQLVQDILLRPKNGNLNIRFVPRNLM